jgi:hypothetical protein
MLLRKNQKKKDGYLYRVDLFNIIHIYFEPYFNNRCEAF